MIANRKRNGSVLIYSRKITFFAFPTWKILSRKISSDEKVRKLLEFVGQTFFEILCFQKLKRLLITIVLKSFPLFVDCNCKR